MALNFIILTCRPKDFDFRYHLAFELNALGNAVTYIFLKRRPLILDMATGKSVEMTMFRFLVWFGRLRTRSPDTLVFNSTNLAFPFLNALLRTISGTRWILDMHDDLLYSFQGVARWRAACAQRFILSQSDLVVHAAPTLKRLFPRSHHIGNGSSLQALPKTREDQHRVLVMASLDRRFDFDLMAAAAATLPRHSFDIYGRISQGDADIRAHLSALTTKNPNVTYHGPYSDLDLPGLMARYIVAFAPYRVGIRITEFIDPLRFYHCLASNTGLVSTAIPQAVAMQDRIVIMTDITQLEAALDRAIQERSGETTSWYAVAEKLMAVVARQLSVIKLG